MYHTLVTSMDNITFWFDACKVRSCANVSIVGAMINGPYEIFHVSLELISYLDCKIGLEHDHATINITNYGKAFKLTHQNLFYVDPRSTRSWSGEHYL